MPKKLLKVHKISLPIHGNRFMYLAILVLSQDPLKCRVLVLMIRHKIWIQSSGHSGQDSHTLACITEHFIKHIKLKM